MVRMCFIKRLIAVLVLGFVGLIVYGHWERYNSNRRFDEVMANTSKVIAQLQEPNALQVTDWKWHTNSSFNTVEVQGTLKSDSSNPRTYVQITWNIYDKSGSQIGNAWANANFLAAYGTWKFKGFGTYSGGKPHTAQVANITSF